jgi:hypothetical protein
MKTLIRSFSFCFFLVLAALAWAATPPVDVMVADSSGKVAYKGKTGANGTFSTGKLQPGNYVVQFSGNNVKGTYALVVSAGKKKVSADAVPGEKFGKGGVAMKVDVGAGMNVTGQVVTAPAAGSNPNVKVENGVTYYWVKGGTGSNIGGRWLTKEEAKAQGLNLGTYSKEAIQSIQEKAYNPQG